MLEYIKLHNFKVHKHTELELKPITILTGINGMGKSSIIQALLLLRQSQIGPGRIEGLNLKGDLCDAGTAVETLCQEADDGTIGIGFTSSEMGETRYLFGLNKEWDTYLPLKEELDGFASGMDSLYTTDFQYISAFRSGPLPSYTRDTFVVTQNKQISKEKGQCEYAVHYLYENGESLDVLPEIRYKDTESLRLADQVAYWMEAIAPDISIKIVPQGNDLKLNYRYRREGKTPTRDISALNTGFGITYMLPLLVALLGAQPGALIIIENPEAHVHPRAQAVFMELVSKCAQAGIQVILETHSDHIINGAMVAVHDGYPVKDIAIYYIEREIEEHVAHVERLNVQQNGRILNAPQGFCDQIDIDLEHIIGF